MPDQPPKLTLGDVLTRPALRREHTRRARIQSAHRELRAAIDDPLARTLLVLHRPTAIGDCDGCDFDGHEGEPPAWPCRTVSMIAAHHGITLEQP